VEQLAAKCESRLVRLERRQNTRDEETATNIVKRLEVCERLLGLGTRDDAGELDGVQAAREARAHAESLAAVNKRNRDFWAAEQERLEKQRA